MNIQNSNKICANCKHWADGWCLVQQMGKNSEHVCNAWKLSLLYDIDKPVVAYAHWVMTTERLPNKTGWYLAGLINHWGEPYTNEIYFVAESIRPHWGISVYDKVYCWLDEVPELPEPPENNDEKESEE